jgi:hypothetical protein
MEVRVGVIMADSGMPAGPNMDEVIYERIIHDKPWMWALVSNTEFQPTPPPQFSTDPYAWWTLVHRMMVDDWAFEFYSPGAKPRRSSEPLTVFYVRVSRLSDDKIEDGKGFGDTMWEATGRAVLDAVRS